MNFKSVTTKLCVVVILLGVCSVSTASEENGVNNSTLAPTHTSTILPLPEEDEDFNNFTQGELELSGEDSTEVPLPTTTTLKSTTTTEETREDEDSGEEYDDETTEEPIVPYIAQTAGNGATKDEGSDGGNHGYVSNGTAPHTNEAATKGDKPHKPKHVGSSGNKSLGSIFIVAFAVVFFAQVLSYTF